MSRLGEKIRKSMRMESAPMGFGATATRTRTPSMLLLVQGPVAKMPQRGDLSDTGVDAVLLSLGDPERETREVEKWVKESGDVPCGAQVASASGKAAAALKETGVDFLAFDAEATSAEALLATELGYVLVLSGEPSDSFLRAMEPLRLDALLVPDWRPPLTVQGQLELQRLVLLSRTPLIVPVPLDVAPGELECLRDAGVAAVAVNAADSATWDRLTTLRRAIDELPPRRRRREERAEALLPSVGKLAVHAEEEEDEEEEEFPEP
jgi:hypothetical protein